MTPKILDSSKEPIPYDEPDLNWFNRERIPTGAEPECFDQSRIADPKKRHEKILLKGDVPDAPSPIKSPKECAFGLRISHRRYEKTVGMDLSLTEISPGHLVAADPCCLSEADCKQIQTALLN